jgi:hypothetical protein
MKRFILSAAIAAMVLTGLAFSGAKAGGSSNSGSHHSGRSHREFKPSERFNYDRHGRRSFSWSRYRWSDYYRGYCYWAPNYGWYFYEPSHCCYLPLSCYSEVYPESVSTAPAVLRTSPTVAQQTTVVTVAPAPAIGQPEPPPIPPVAPPATAVQQTKVGAGLP